MEDPLVNKALAGLLISQEQLADSTGKHFTAIEKEMRGHADKIREVIVALGGSASTWADALKRISALEDRVERLEAKVDGG